MHCILCGSPGTGFIRAVHTRHGIVYLCEACARAEERHLRRVERACGCDPDALD
jgi:ribosome-binding protein aMBF1 (putative translation factor)